MDRDRRYGWGDDRGHQNRDEEWGGRGWQSRDRDDDWRQRGGYFGGREEEGGRSRTTGHRDEDWRGRGYEGPGRSASSAYDDRDRATYGMARPHENEPRSFAREWERDYDRTRLGADDGSRSHWSPYPIGRTGGQEYGGSYGMTGGGMRERGGNSAYAYGGGYRSGEGGGTTGWGSGSGTSGYGTGGYVAGGSPYGSYPQTYGGQGYGQSSHGLPGSFGNREAQMRQHTYGHGAGDFGQGRYGISSPARHEWDRDGDRMGPDGREQHDGGGLLHRMGEGIRNMFGGDRDRERGPFFGKGPKGYRRSDERVREEVCECISRHGWIDASDVDIRVQNGEVVLSGTVRDREDKRRLEAMIEDLHGVHDVKNELRVKRDEQARLGSSGASTTAGATTGAYSTASTDTNGNGNGNEAKGTSGTTRSRT